LPVPLVPAVLLQPKNKNTLPSNRQPVKTDGRAKHGLIRFIMVPFISSTVVDGSNFYPDWDLRVMSINSKPFACQG
jgi:hypothetical protein